jgi:hypothetical protein
MNKEIGSISFSQVIAKMFNGLESCPQENAEWCLLCDRPIRNGEDLIQHSNTHNCPEGLRLRRQLLGNDNWGQPPAPPRLRVPKGLANQVPRAGTQSENAM